MKNRRRGAQRRPHLGTGTFNHARARDAGLATFFPASRAFPHVSSPFELVSSSLGRLDQWETLVILAKIAWQLATSWEADLYATQRKLAPGVLSEETIDRLNAFMAESGPARVAVFVLGLTFIERA